MLRTIKNRLVSHLLPPLAYGFLALLRMTLRISHVNRGAVEEIWQRGDSIISCFWHGRLLAMPFAYKRGQGKVLISRHRDGEFIARVVRYFGLEAIRGSYGKAGRVSSLREMLRAAKKDQDIGITPDGPKGPRHRMKKGILEFARMSRRPIVPVSYGATKKKLFHSWDEFVLPLPFAKIVFIWGNPTYIDPSLNDDQIEELRVQIEQQLVDLTARADRMTCGNTSTT